MTFETIESNFYDKIRQGQIITSVIVRYNLQCVQYINVLKLMIRNIILVPEGTEGFKQCEE